MATSFFHPPQNETALLPSKCESIRRLVTSRHATTVTSFSGHAQPPAATEAPAELTRCAHIKSNTATTTTNENIYLQSHFTHTNWSRPGTVSDGYGPTSWHSRLHTSALPKEFSHFDGAPAASQLLFFSRSHPRIRPDLFWRVQNFPTNVRRVDLCDCGRRVTGDYNRNKKIANRNQSSVSQSAEARFTRGRVLPTTTNGPCGNGGYRSLPVPSYNASALRG